MAKETKKKTIPEKAEHEKIVPQKVYDVPTLVKHSEELFGVKPYVAQSVFDGRSKLSIENAKSIICAWLEKGAK